MDLSGVADTTTTFDNLKQYIKISFVEVQNDGQANEITSAKQCGAQADFSNSESIF